jgi:dipeptidyl aminopeptidase/acylaminoacyl peptidase
MIDWKAADGLALRGVLTLPTGRTAKNLPLVVLPHGGPEARDYPVFDWWAQAFAARGYAVFQPNFRGSAGYGVAFRNAGFGQWGRKMQTDISDGVAELARQGVIDPKRACIVGGSYGGYAALAGVTVQQGLYRCAVSVAGVSDPGGLLRDDRARGGGASTTTRYWRTFMGATSLMETELNTISPLKLASRADAPILLIHGKDDTVVPPQQSAAMEAALQQAGKTVELIWMPGEDHWLSRDATRVQMLTSAVAFVEKYDPPDAAVEARQTSK